MHRGASSPRLRLRWRVGLLLSVLFLLPGAAHATVVSRLGDIYFYDPQTFDAGIMQRGLTVRTGGGPDGGLLELGAEAPFYRELVVRVSYVQNLDLDFDLENIRRLSWQTRIPVWEDARYGWLSTGQLLYAGSRGFGSSSRFIPEHALGMGYSSARSGLAFASTTHFQANAVLRRREASSDDLYLRRIGLNARFAYIMQLYRPPPGFGGKWTVTFSVVEAEVTHFGYSSQRGGDGQLSLSLVGPAIHFTHRHMTLSVGALPRVHWTYEGSGAAGRWEALATFAFAQRNYLE